MTYLQPRNRERIRRNRIIAGVAIAIAVVVAITQVFTPHFFPRFFTAVARPFWREAFMIDAGGFNTDASLIEQNQSLQLELDDLRLSIASSTTAMLESQNRDLLSFFNRASTTSKSYKLAAVIARPDTLSSDKLIIDLGESDGIASTSRIYAPGRVLIGKVQDLLPNSAQVILFSSPREAYSVSIGAKHVPATAVGRGGGQYKADVPHGSAVLIGDVVSDNSLYDRAFGVVISVITDPANPFDTVLIAPPVNVSELRYVLVDIAPADKPVTAPPRSTVAPVRATSSVRR